MGLEQIDLVDRAGGEGRDERARAVGRDGEAARFASERGAPLLVTTRGVEGDERAIRDRRDVERGAIGRQRDAIRLDRRLDRPRDGQAIAYLHDGDAIAL